MPRRILALAASALCLLALLSIGCDDDEGDTWLLAPGSLYAAPDTVWLADTDPSGVVFLSSGSPDLEWRAVPGRPWLSTDPQEGTVGDDVGEITVTAVSTGLTEGIHGGSVAFISSGGEDQVWVMFTVGWHPSASLAPATFDLDADTDTAELLIGNTGSGDLHWTLQTDAAWLTVTPASGIVPAGDSVTVDLAVAWSSLDPGEYETTLQLGGNAENLPLAVAVAKTVPARGVLDTPDAVAADIATDALTVPVENVGNVAVDWTASTEASFLSVSPASGATEPGAVSPLTVTIDRDGLEGGTHHGSVIVASADRADTVAVTVTHYVDSLWHLDFAVRDAEYDRNQDVIIALGVSPHRLYRLDPAARSVTAVDLSLAPISVSLAPDGTEAVVGHDGQVSQVDLNALSVTAVHPVAAEAFDIVHGGNGWAYVFPEEDQHCSVKCLDMATGAVTDNTGWLIYENTRGKLHPGGQWMYAADNGLSPSDFEKFDIAGGTAARLYDSPYHGDYAFSGNIWISDDGARLYARSSNVFRTSSVQSEDMIYAGQLAGIGAVQWLDHSTAAGRVFAVSGGTYWDDPLPQVYVYDADYLTELESIDLIPFAAPGGAAGYALHDALGRYVFADQAGEHLHVVEQAPAESGLLQDWAVASFELLPIVKPHD